MQEVKVCKTEDCQAGLPWSVLVVMHMSDPNNLVGVEVLSIHVFSPWL